MLYGFSTTAIFASSTESNKPDRNDSDVDELPRMISVDKVT